jgi:hypothetical protein
LEENVQNSAQVRVQSPTKSSRNAAQELGLSDQIVRRLKKER